MPKFDDMGLVLLGYGSGIARMLGVASNFDEERPQ